MRALMGGESLGPRAIEIAIRDECADAGQRKLTTVSVPGEDQVGSVTGHAIENAQVGRVHDTECEISFIGKLPGDIVVTVA